MGFTTGFVVVGFGDSADVLEVLEVLGVGLAVVGVVTGVGVVVDVALGEGRGALRARRSAAETCPPPGVPPVSHTRATSPRAASRPAPAGSRHDRDR
ncbi:hypothetical protein ACWEOE_25440 [Amycolatopsis sp. NPDC004368]